MRRLLVLTAIVGGIWLLISTVTMNFGRQGAAATSLYFNENGRFYRMQADGSDKTQIADVDFYSAAWPTAGGWFVASGRRERGSQNFDLFRADFFGRRFRPIARTGLSDQFLALSPDMMGLVFQSNERLGTGRVYYVDINGREASAITPELYFPTVVSWTADGWIILRGTQLEQNNLYRVQADGTGFERLATDLDYIQWVGTTPDEEWLVLVGYHPNVALDIFRMRMDGSRLENLTLDSRGYNDFPMISPNGEWIVYRYHDTTQTIMRRMRLDGSNDQVLTDHEIVPVAHSADGRWLYYFSGQGRQTSLNRIHVDGGLLENIDNDVSVGNAGWSPNHRWFLYYKYGEDNYRSRNKLFALDSKDNRTYRLDGLYDYVVTSSQNIWSVDSKWIYFVRLDGQRRTFERIRPTGRDRQVLTTIEEEFFFVGEAPIVDLQYSANLLVILGVLGIGGSLCGGYWFSRR